MKTGTKRRLQTVAASKRARRALWLTPLFGLTFALLTTVASAILFKVGNELWIKSRGAAESVLRPTAATWFALAIPIGIGAAILVWDKINAFLLGPAPPNFSTDYALANSPTLRWLRLCAAAVIGLCVFLSALNVRKHVRLTQDAIVDQRALAWHEQVYPYSQVNTIRVARYYITPSKSSRGGPSRNPALFITLRDGRRWSTTDSELLLDRARNAELAEQIAARSGRVVDYSSAVLDQPTPKEEKTAALRLLIFYLIVFVALQLFLRFRKTHRA